MAPSERRAAAAAAAAAPALGVAAVARRLGVAPATLRTWARRYGLGPSEHEAGAHRRYTPDDLARLVVMRQLTLEGVPPGAAALAAVQRHPVDEVSSVAASESALPLAAPAVGEAAAEPVDAPAASAPWADGIVGDRIPFTRRPSPAGRDELQQAALRSDAETCTRIVAAACTRLGPVAAWESLVHPALRSLGRRWEATAVGIDTEVLLTAAVLAALRGLPVPPSRTSAVVLLAAAEGETSSLPLHVLAAAVAADGAQPRVVAAGLPREALAAAVRRTGPAAVLVHAERTVPDAAQLGVLPRLRAPSRLVLSGPGWSGVRLPEGRAVQLAPALADAQQLLAAATAPLAPA
jgi:transposase-like protein